MTLYCDFKSMAYFILIGLLVPSSQRSQGWGPDQDEPLGACGWFICRVDILTLIE